MEADDKHQLLEQYLLQHPEAVGKVVDYDPTVDKLYTFDFRSANTELSPDDVNDTAKFSAWVNRKLKDDGYRYGIGGYMENRTLYARSALFNTDEEPRRLHLGVDIWGDAGTPVYAPLAGKVHSFQDNDNFGDYGPTIILEHDLNGLVLYTLYGHLNKECLDGLYEGKPFVKNQPMATFGDATENGSWPPHLHFQLMFDMGGREGDYPGVGLYSQQEALKQNIPDPELLLRFNR
ncbi:peptidoglycan DD-metalloendopeptidase family protein [Mucilaginibacter myungsuensis]|uniref:Peptidoglycan DD-metalloendopeptidase family protein n=1 Tax=Mucilaginibacter myungsuensis TaxID=649104 RepID=A0A929L4T4_9SPHI|nr:peptidoglycan DD-metalloendopeptidase family protein [Mucilaginibacter myungsuensis]MBE9664020.1 peptidoglycan DD-metalloendopeptidase family protein [Mucilaginibacter myungsuensis]MDN3601199.1 peptidoglycan DD-metalloendopeptidase family protein [Mucilaginibacter myungsuensis]